MQKFIQWYIYIHDSTFCNLTIDLFIFDTTVYFLSTHLAVVKLACDLSPECNYIIILIDFLSRFPRSSSSHGVYKMYALASSFDKSASFHLKSSREWGSLRLLLT